MGILWTAFRSLTTTYDSQLSGGWDRRISIWCLETGELQDRFRNTNLDPSAMEIDEEENKEELACDGVIIDMEYCESR